MMFYIGLDLLRIKLVGLLQHKGVQVVGLFYQGGRHGIFVGDPSMSVKVFDLLKTLH